MDRGTRRALTARAIQRTVSDQASVNRSSNSGWVSPWLDTVREARWKNTHRFAKRKSLSCSCRRRRHGNPKVCWGGCNGNMDHVGAWRQLDRKLRQEVRRGNLEWDTDEIAMLEDRLKTRKH